MATKLAIFDLDGTLLNTIGDLAEAANHMLALRNLPQHDYPTYCTFVGNGIMRLVERALPEELRTTEYVAAARRDFLDYYIDHIDQKTVPYTGITELLSALQARGVRLAVASNKFQAGTEKLIRSYFPEIRFEVVFGQRPEVPLKPDPAVVEEILTLTGVKREEVLYVGDSGVDMLTALNAQVDAVGVTWGFRPKLELSTFPSLGLIDKAEELLNYI
jgi:phosphoglycolate phosphatase